MDLKTVLRLQNGIFFSVVRVTCALKSNEDLPVLGNTHTNRSFGTVKLTFFNIVSKKIFNA